MNFSIKRFYLSLYWCVDIALFILYYGNPHAGVGNGYINVYTVYYNLFLPVCLFVSVTVCMSLSLCLSLSLSVSVSCLFSSTGFLLTVFLWICAVSRWLWHSFWANRSDAATLVPHQRTPFSADAEHAHDVPRLSSPGAPQRGLRQRLGLRPTISAFLVAFPVVVVSMTSLLPQPRWSDHVN